MRIEAILVEGTEPCAIEAARSPVPLVRLARTIAAIEPHEVDAYRRHQVLRAGLHAPAYPIPLLDSEIRRILACRLGWRAVLELTLDAGLVALGDVPCNGAPLDQTLEAVIASIRPRDLVVLTPRPRKPSAGAHADAPAIVEDHLPHVGMGLHVVGREAAALLLAATDAVDRPLERLLGMPWVHGVRELHAWPGLAFEASTARSAPTAQPSAFAGTRGAVARARLAAYDVAVRRARRAWQGSHRLDYSRCSVSGIRKCLAQRVIAAQPSPVPSTRKRIKNALTDLVRRRQPATALPLPTVILAGAMRGGTTSLFSWLAQHPQVVASQRKEVHFFDLEFARGPDWYRRQFAGGRHPALRRLEATPYYMFEPRVPQRMRDLIPDARIVCLLRDPVERALSHYLKNRRDGREPLSFSDALSAEDERMEGEEERLLADPAYRSRVHQHYSYRRRGYYADQIQRLHSHFPEEQILLVDAGALFAHPARTVARVVSFLGLDSWEPRSFPVRNATSRESPLSESERARWTAHFAPHERRLESMIGWCPSCPSGDM